MRTARGFREEMDEQMRAERREKRRLTRLADKEEHVTTIERDQDEVRIIRLRQVTDPTGPGPV